MAISGGAILWGKLGLLSAAAIGATVGALNPMISGWCCSSRPDAFLTAAAGAAIGAALLGPPAAWLGGMAGSAIARGGIEVPPGPFLVGFLTIGLALSLFLGMLIGF